MIIDPFDVPNQFSETPDPIPKEFVVMTPDEKRYQLDVEGDFGIFMSNIAKEIRHSKSLHWERYLQTINEMCLADRAIKVLGAQGWNVEKKNTKSGRAYLYGSPKK